MSTFGIHIELCSFQIRIRWDIPRPEQPKEQDVHLGKASTLAIAIVCGELFRTHTHIYIYILYIYYIH